MMPEEDDADDADEEAGEEKVAAEEGNTPTTPIGFIVIERRPRCLRK